MVLNGLKLAQSKRETSDRLSRIKQLLRLSIMKIKDSQLLILAFAIAISIDPHGREMLQHSIDPTVHAHLGEFARWGVDRIFGLIFDEFVKWVYSRFLPPWLRW